MTDPRDDFTARRAAGLDAALAAVRGRRRRRHTSRGLGATALLALAAALAWPRTPAAPEPPADAPAVATRTDPDPVPKPGWVVVGNDPDIVARLAAPPVDVEGAIVRDSRPTMVEFLDDDGLGEWLRRAGKRPGRLRIGDRVIVPAVAAE